MSLPTNCHTNEFYFENCGCLSHDELVRCARCEPGKEGRRCEQTFQVVGMPGWCWECQPRQRDEDGAVAAAAEAVQQSSFIPQARLHRGRSRSPVRPWRDADPPRKARRSD
jgi:hypothetical protein